MFAELPQTPLRRAKAPIVTEDVSCLAEQLSSIHIEDEPRRTSPRKSEAQRFEKQRSPSPAPVKVLGSPLPPKPLDASTDEPETSAWGERPSRILEEESLRILTWDEVCPPGDEIAKIAEASAAEVYRVTNERGTSIIKVIRLDSPIKPPSAQQIRARLVDEQPHCEQDIEGELRISQWLADIPGFVVYKERYIVQGKATQGLLETHQKFQRRAKRRDPGRAQFYPSPRRYLDGTRFLVVELGDAGTALEDWKLLRENELWDVFFLEAIALARAEDLAMFEVSDAVYPNIQHV